MKLLLKVGLGRAPLLLLALGVSLTTSCCRTSERSLRKGFEENRAVLDSIVDLAREDEHLVRIAPDFTQLEDDWSWPRPRESWGITEARWDRYRQLFREADIDHGITHDEEGTVYFLAEACGLSISGRSSGYLYSSTRPSPIVDRLSDLQSKGIAYVPLEGPWYLFAERD